MTAYLVNRRYRAWFSGERFDWQPGQVVDLSPGQAEWANRDCDGVLSLVEAEPVPVQEPDVSEPASADPAADSGEAETSAGDGSGAAEDTNPADESPAEPGQPPVKNRGGRPRKAR